jgi:outer membrane receptor protein involved in Fe transport
LPPGTPITSTNLANGNYFETTTCPVGNIFAFSQINSPQNTEVSQSGRQLCFQYPYSTFELDTFYGTTFSFIHPMGDGFLDLTYDYHGQSTFAYANAPENIQVPYSGTRYSTISLTGDIRAIKNVSIPIGLYDTTWTVNGQIINTNPNGNFCPGATAGDGTICGLQRYETHIDPHIAFVWHPHSNDSVRLAYGTSTTYPFIGDLSGAPAFQPPASGYSDGLLTYKTPTLQPEHSIAFSIGADHRFKNGAILSIDLTNTVVHNVFQQILSSAPFDPNLGVFTPLNIALLQSKVGVIKYNYAPRYGLGYNVSFAADSSITSGVPASLMSSFPLTLPANNVQICGNGLFTPGAATCIPYLKGYGQVNYTSLKGLYAGLGFDFEGKNNAYYQPPFAIWDLTVRQTIEKDFDIQASVQNLLNTNSYNHLAAPNLGTPVTSNYTTNGTTILQGSYPTYLIPAVTRVINFSLRYHVGRS